MNIKQKFGQRVRELREEIGLSQEALALQAGVHRTYLSSVEKGDRNISIVNIEKLANALEIQISDLTKNL